MELDLKERLLTPKPTSAASRPLFQGLEFRDGFKKRSHGVRSWIRVDDAGNAQMVELDKISVMRRCHLPARDLRLLDPLLVHPSTILGRESAIIVNLEQIRCIITADEVLLLNSRYVFTQYVVELQRRLNGNGAGSRNSSSYDLDDVPNGSSSTDGLPFELRALEVVLDVAYTFLGAEAAELETEAYPLLDELTSKISTLNLEKVRRLKSKLVALTRRVQKVRDELDRLMDAEGDMAEMYLTEKKLHMHSTMCANHHQSMASFSSTSAGISVSATSSPVSSFPTEIRPFEKCVNITHSGGHESIKSTGGSGKANIDELEMLLESYFIVTDSSLNKLTSLKEYIDDTEVFINIQLDNVRNQLIQFELLLTTATFVVAIFGVVAGVFGMNFSISIFDEPAAFKWVLLITGACGVFIFYAFLWFFRCKRWMPL